MGSTGVISSLEYLQQSNDALLTIVQIETKEALENVRQALTCNIILAQLSSGHNVTADTLKNRWRRLQKFPELTCCSSGLGI